MRGLDKGNDLNVEESLINSMQRVKKRSTSKKGLSQVLPQVDLNRVSDSLFASFFKSFIFNTSFTILVLHTTNSG